MTEYPDENVTLETPRDWVRQGERRAARQWAASHPAKPIEPPRPEGGVRRWPGALLFAFILAMALLSLVTAPMPGPHRPPDGARAPRATITNPPPGPKTTITTPTAQATLTHCSNTMVSGRLTNTSRRTQTFVIAVSLERGAEVRAFAEPNLFGVPPGGTVTWHSPVTVAPAGSVTCSLFSVQP